MLESIQTGPDTDYESLVVVLEEKTNYPTTPDREDVANRTISSIDITTPAAFS
jgi:hypothetical protein